MRSETFFKNREIPKAFVEKTEEMLQPDEQPLFALVGDLDMTADYDDSAMIVTSRRAFFFDRLHSGGLLVFELADITDASVKRMYGNAKFIVDTENGSTEAMRFTYSIAVLAETVAAFFQNIHKDGEFDKEVEVVHASFEKLKLRCPVCGRALSRPGAQCFNCNSKNKVLKKLFKYVRPNMKKLVFCLILAVITSSMALVPPYLTKTLVDDIIPNSKLRAISYVVLTLFILNVFQHAIGAFRGYLLRITGDKVLTRIRNDVYAKAQYLPMSFYDKTSIGAIISRIGNDTNSLNDFLLRISQEAVIQLFTMIGIIVIMFVLNPKLTLLSLIPVPLVVIGARIFGKKIAPVYHRIWRRWSSVNSVLSDSLPGIRVVKSFTSESRSISRFEQQNDQWLREDIRAAALINSFPQIVSFCISCGTLLIWAFGGRWVIQNPGTMSLGLLVSFISYSAMFYGPVSFFANLSDAFQHAITSAERLFDIIDAEPEPNFGKGNIIDKVEGKIEFRNVNFSFDKTKKILENINFVIEPGEIIGIVGTTGSGKSTLINLLLRFYDSYEGEILVDGVNIRDIDLEAYRGMIGYVQQEPMMFRDTVFNNIAYSRPDATVEAVIEAADIANSHGFIEKLPDAYDTLLGERGVGLSGGERQRISIARAVLKNPSILVFDEATASVDSETEHLIQEAIERLISGRTTIMIAHRLSTLNKANKIIVVDNGEIIEFGSHDELMALKGKYYRLIEIQSLNGKEPEQNLLS